MFDELDQLLRRIGKRLPVAEATSTDQARREVSDAFSKPHTLRITVRRSRGTAIFAAAALLLGAGTGFSVGQSLAAPSGTHTRIAAPSFGVGFLPARGWNVIQNGLSASGGATAVAANVPLRPDDMAVSGPPLQTIAALRGAGVIITATVYRPGTAAIDVNFPIRQLPVRLADSTRVPSAESRQAFYRLLANVRGQNLDVRTYFGSPAPGAAAFAAAQAELERLVVAAAPSVTIAARPTLITAFDPVTVFGSTADGKSGNEIRIEAKECGFNFFHVVDAATTSTSGGWTAQIGAEITSVFRARWNNNTSDEVRVVVRPRVRLESKTKSRFTVSVQARDRFVGKKVAIQRFQSATGRWTTVKRVSLQRLNTQYGGGGSTATTRVRVRRGSLMRAVLAKSQVGRCYAAGISPVERA